MIFFRGLFVSSKLEILDVGKEYWGVRFWEFGKVGQATNTSREPTFVFVFCSPFFHLHAIFSWLYFVEQCDLFFVAIVSISLKGL